MQNLNILCVDDEESLGRAFGKLAQQRQWSFASAKNGLEAIEHLSRNRVDVALVDLNLPGFSGLQVLEYIKANSLTTEVILMTGSATIETAISALKKGAYDYLTKPFDDIERVALVIEKALEKAGLVKRIKSLEMQGWEDDQYQNIFGRSVKMREVFRLIESIAPSTSNVLILGESGTGKELVAKAVHEKSRRKEKPFVVINCSALPETLLESELFGYQKGSFTGAYADKKGLFEEADGGTIFLDEIGEVPLSVQVKLLRVLQDREVRRIGGIASQHVDVRLIAATNKDLYQQVKKKEFREDLFYRLNVITVPLPPLRERREDIPLLAYLFLKKFAERSSKTVRQISIDTLQTLQEHDWPGNVRELENVMERAVVLASSDTITARELPPNLLGEFFYLPEAPGSKADQDLAHFPYKEAKEKALNLFNRTYISNLLRITSGNITLASEKAGMDRSNFKKIVSRCELNVREFKRKSE